MRHAFVVTVLLLAACNKDSGGPAAASSGSATPSSQTAAAPHSAAAPAAPLAKDGTPATIQNVAQAIGGSPVQAVLKSAKTDHDSYLVTFEFTNKGPKETKAVGFSSCTYDKGGALMGSPPANGVDVVAKPNGKGTADVYLGSQATPPAAAALAVTSVVYADGTKWSDMMVSCPAHVKL